MKLEFHFLQRWSLVMLLLGLTTYAFGQRTITGTVTDASNGDPLIGANVLVVGTSSGTVADIDGTYSLTVPDGATELEFSYTGFSSKRVPITNSDVLDVQLDPGEELEEIVVVGYGSVKKSDLTGAVTAVSEEEFNKGVIVSPEELIQGRAPGVQITQTNGEPGAGVNIRIRGTSSVRSNNNPLFVVDGVPLSGEETSAGGRAAGLGTTAARNPLNFLNPNDIASIDILKDASATAIYGSRGANGVVIITTKSGAEGTGVLDYSYSLGIAGISNRYDLLERDEFLAAYTDFNGAQAAAAVDGGADTDWQDEAFRTALTHNHNFSFGGGNSQGNYRFSLSFMDQEGIVEESGLKRVSGRFNGSRKFIDDRLNISAQFTVANNHDDNVAITTNSGFRGDLMGNILKANPTQPVRDKDGNFVQPGITEPNPIAILNLSESFTNTLRALGNLSAELTILEGFTFKSVIGFDRSFSQRTDAFSRDLVIGNNKDIGRLFLDDIETDNQLWENYFTYTKNFGRMSFTGLLGYSYQSFERSGNTTEYANFRTSNLYVLINILAAADQSEDLASAIGRNSFRTLDELQSFYGRANLNFDEKYLVTATLRADGSTRFGSGNQYGYFPSFAFKWRLIQESFVPDAFSDLGLRLGFGITGNQEIPHNLFQERQRYEEWDINDGADNTTGGNLSSVAFANPDLKWESTTQYNVGLDFGFLGSRLTGTLDFYYKTTNDLLIQITSAQPAVTEFVWNNLDADVINQGIELGLNGVIVDRNNFGWDVQFNIAYNDNEVRNFDGLINTGDIDGQGLTGAFAQRIAEGQPLYAYFLRQFGGFDSEGISIYPNGDFQEFNGTSPLPTVSGGLTNTFRYKNLDLNIFFAGQFGHYIYSNTANALFTAGSLANGRNVTKDVVGNGEGALNAPDVSTRFLEKGDFVRLQNVSLGYTFGTVGPATGVRVFVTGQNLFVITGYSGQDPEVSISKPINDVPSIGIDYTTYPRSTTITFGANVSF